MDIETESLEKNEIFRYRTYDEGYDSSGYRLFFDPETDEISLFTFSHCSCYGTEDGTHHTPDYTGSSYEFYVIACNRLDCTVSVRSHMQPGDCDYNQWRTMYDEYIKWYQKSVTKGLSMSIPTKIKIINTKEQLREAVRDLSIQSPHSILSICLAAHMHITGSCDCLEDHIIYNDYHYLLTRYLDFWDDTSSKFDLSVKNVIITTIEEINQSYLDKYRGSTT